MQPMTLALVCVALAASAMAMPLHVASPMTSFEDWKYFHQKEYSTSEVESIRRAIWNQNRDYINQFNSEGHSYTLAMNEFGDLVHSEFAAMYLPSRMDISRRSGNLHQTSGLRLPSSVDWTSKGFVTPVKNQGQCGSCWAFSTTGSVEGQHFNATGKLVSLSEQNLVDCSSSFGNQGCNGGLMDNAFKYIIKAGGLDTEESYPYEGSDGTCRFDKSNVGATISSYRDVHQGSEADLKDASATVGPISVAIDASHMSFQFYSHGVYEESKCSSTMLDHGVLVVGYGTESGKDYWLVKNSWGTTWGLEGYIKMARNENNMCGIATSASYPIV